MKRQPSQSFALSVFLSIAWGIPTDLLRAEAYGKPLSISIRTYNYARVPRSILESARAHATRVFRRAGFSAKWHDCRLSASESRRDAACEQALSGTDVVLKLLPPEMSDQFGAPRGTLGFALPAETSSFGTAHVFVERSEEIVRQLGWGDAEELRALLLGLAVAHEAGHLLLGWNSHSGTGLMKPSWDKLDVRYALQGALGFTHDQAFSARTAIAERVASFRD